MTNKPNKPIPAHRHELSANNAFIGCCLRIDAALKRISDARANHFGVDPEGQRNWGEAGSAEKVAADLERLADWIEGKAR